MACLMATVLGQAPSAAAIAVDGAMVFFTGREHTHGEVVTVTPARTPTALQKAEANWHLETAMCTKVRLSEACPTV